MEKHRHPGRRDQGRKSSLKIGRTKLFEAVHTVLWYLGPMQPEPTLDFMGASDAALTAGMPLYFGVAAVALFATAVAGRWFKMLR